MKLYINTVDQNKTLVLYKIKYKVATVKNKKMDSKKFYIGYAEDIQDNLQLVSEFYRYLENTHYKRNLMQQHLDTDISSITYIKDLKVEQDEKGMYVSINNTENPYYVFFGESFYHEKNIVKVG